MQPKTHTVAQKLERTGALGAGIFLFGPPPGSMRRRCNPFGFRTSGEKPVLVRAFEDSDEREVTELWNEVSQSDAPHNEPALAIRQKLSVERDLFLVAALDGAVVGTVMGGYDGHRGWVYALAVSPRYRRRGIATALVRQLESDLAKRGCLKVNLQVRAANLGVVPFYEKLGFCVEDLVSMGKRLYTG
jgi:ribosomal protein S18 acetylase RimI-like enzyme